MANFTALAAARHAVLARAGWDVEARGLFGAPPIQVVVGEEAHPSVFKSLGMLGLGRERVVRVPVDGEGRMLRGELPQLSATEHRVRAGRNVNTGAFDPVAEICRSAHAGALGCMSMARSDCGRRQPAYAHLVDGLADADSWATDAHKWLNVTYDSGLAFVRDADHLRGAMSLTAAYLPQGERREPLHYMPELSRRARGVDFWAALKSLGRSGLAELDRTQLPLRPALCRRPCRRRLRNAERRGVESGAGVLWLAGGHRAGDRGVQEDGTCWCGPPCGRGGPRCASAFPPGPRPKRTWTAAWKRWCGSRGSNQRRDRERNRFHAEARSAQRKA